MSFIPHTADDISLMLAAIGVRSIDDLFEEIPEGLEAKPLGGVPPALCEMEIGACSPSARRAMAGCSISWVREPMSTTSPRPSGP